MDLSSAWLARAAAVYGNDGDMSGWADHGLGGAHVLYTEAGDAAASVQVGCYCQVASLSPWPAIACMPTCWLHATATR